MMFTYWSSLSRPWLMQKFRKQKFAAHARRVRTIGLHGGDDLLTLVMERDCIACAAQGGRRGTRWKGGAGGTRWKGGAGREGAHEEPWYRRRRLFVLYVVSKFVRTRSCHSCGKEGGSDWLRLHFKGDSQFKAGPPLPPGFTSTSMPPQKKKIIFGSVFAFFSHFFWGANSEWGFPTSMPPAEKFFIFDSIITLFRPFFFLGRTRSGVLLFK